jgi:cell division protein ZipA
MDLTIRDWMVIVGVLLIMAVLLDAWRRIRREKTAQVRMKLADPEEPPTEREVNIALFGELPNGGARVVDRGDILKAAGFDTGTAHSSSGKSNLATGSTESGVSDVGEQLIAGISSSEPDGGPENVDWLDGLDTAGSQESSGEKGLAAGKLPRAEAPEVFMLNVLSRDPKGLNGDDILQILLACDLRFGDMSFFHRSEFEAGRGAIQFSVANMMQPGVFDIDNMADLATPGLVFFLTLPGPEDMMQAFDYMLETAQAVARNLGADVLDEARSALTQQTIEHSRQQIRELERRLLAKAR